jgi:plasmid stabilization system protein ParE
MRITYHREAEEELIEAARYYAARGSGLGTAFLTEIDRVVVRIAEHPTRYAVHEHDIRFCLAKKFPYGVYYRVVEGEGIRILAVKHHSRDASYWRHRQ